MKKIGIGIDYSNICKDYNTMYLDRDNTDPATKNCMKKAMKWMEEFLSQLMQTFHYKIYRLNNNTALEIEEIARKRFLFYSLEKEMLAQSFLLQSAYTSHATLADWGQSEEASLLIKNDEEGEGFYLYVNEDSTVHTWLLERLKMFSLETVSFEEK